jgi:hypothetical protein
MALCMQCTERPDRAGHSQDQRLAGPHTAPNDAPHLGCTPQEGTWALKVWQSREGDTWPIRTERRITRMVDISHTREDLDFVEDIEVPIPPLAPDRSVAIDRACGVTREVKLEREGEFHREVDNRWQQ